MSVRLRSLARSNDPLCEAAAGDELAKGGSAVDAVLSGYFAAAGAYPGVLLGPVTLLIGGTGSGDRAFDGRVIIAAVEAKTEGKPQKLLGAQVLTEGELPPAGVLTVLAAVNRIIAPFLTGDEGPADH